MKDLFVYGLVDPRTHQVRYVGKTTGSPERRLKQHLTQASSSDKNDHRLNWIRQLLTCGLKPDLAILEWGPWTIDELNRREIRWIAHYRGLYGRDVLTNISDGGTGGEVFLRLNMRPWTDERRAQHSALMLEWQRKRKELGLDCLGSDEARRQRNENRRRTIDSAEYRQKISMRSRQAWSDSERRKSWIESLNAPDVAKRKSESTKQRYLDPDERARTSEAVKAAMTDDVRQVISKKVSAAWTAKRGFEYEYKVGDERACEACGVIFTVRRPTSRNCSRSCGATLMWQERRR